MPTCKYANWFNILIFSPVLHTVSQISFYQCSQKSQIEIQPSQSALCRRGHYKWPSSGKFPAPLSCSKLGMPRELKFDLLFMNSIFMVDRLENRLRLDCVCACVCLHAYQDLPVNVGVCMIAHLSMCTNLNTPRMQWRTTRSCSCPTFWRSTWRMDRPSPFASIQAPLSRWVSFYHVRLTLHSLCTPSLFYHNATCQGNAIWL